MAMYPVQYYVQSYNHSLSLNAYCPVFTKLLPKSSLVKFLSKKDSHPEWQACAIEILMSKTTELEETSDSRMLALASIAGIKHEGKIYPSALSNHFIHSYIKLFKLIERHDLIAYFLRRRIDRAFISSASDLAMLYYEGKGVPQDKEIAKHLFRLAASRSFPYSLKGAECAAKFEDDLKYAKNNLDAEQVKWFQRLCYKQPEELYKIASWHLQEDNPYREPRIVRHILRNLKQAHNYEDGKN